MTDLEKRVLQLIPIGADNPRQGRYIAMTLQLNIRAVRDIISRLVIKYGVPIVAKRGLVSGYYIPANEQERLEGIRELNAQYNQEGKRLNVLISADLESYKEFLDGTI